MGGTVGHGQALDSMLPTGMVADYHWALGFPSFCSWDGDKVLQPAMDLPYSSMAIWAPAH